VSLNIKSAEADRLVEEVAKLTGESKTQAVIESLRQRLAREHQLRDAKRLAADLLAIGEKCAAYEILEPGSHADLLYGKDGLPR
jgi:antitoxin VapB